MSRQSLWRPAVAALILLVAVAAQRGASATARQDATPAAYSCDPAGPSAAGTPMAEPDHSAMEMGTPTAGMAMEFDLSYIDMMIPHHASIVALAQASLPRLQDERLREIAETIVAMQTAEIDELRGYREQFYGGAEPMPMDEQAMMQVIPEAPVSMDEMMAQMNAATQVATFCAAADPDLVFIDLTIPHHASAIAAAETALDRATHDEIRAFAGRVFEDQRREIGELDAIRQELHGSATPEGSPAAVSHGEPVADQVSVVDALRADGLTVGVAGPLQQPFLQPQAGTVLRISGGSVAAPAEIQVYEYADAGAAAADAAQIGPDGNPRTAIIEWIAPPHFFRIGRVIVLYVGNDPAVLDALPHLLGPQFAGR